MSGKGQCLLSVIPVRAEGKSQAEIVTQLLYGETYSILSQNSEWIEIEIDFDGYKGWISANQFYPQEFDPKGVVFSNRFETLHDQVVPFGASVPHDTGFATMSITDLALLLKGSPYLWGGKTFMGIDCSGFIQVIHKVKNIVLPRDASQQVKHGEAVAFEERRAGDIAFFINENGKVHHVGLLLSQNEIIHASGSVRIDPFSITGIEHATTGNLTHSYFGIRRLK
mgnify:CR=1 FL=1